MKYNTVIFDLDGTLLNTLTDLTDAINHMLAAHRFPLRKEEEIRRFLGNGAKQLVCKSLPDNIDETTLNLYLKEYLEWYSNHSALTTAPYEGILPLLEELDHRGIQTAVVSNKGDLQVKALVEKHFPTVSFAIGERENIRRKPYPDGVLEAMRFLRAEPDKTLLVGDSEVDIQTAKNAGITSVAVGWGFRDKEELMSYQPDIFLTQPADLLKGLLI